MRMLLSISLFLVLGTVVLAPNANATVTLQVSFENFTGGGGGTNAVDENTLSRSLPTGFGSASLAALRVYNESDSSSNTGYHNRSSWAVSGLVFSADTPGTDFANVGVGGQLTALLDGASAAGLFKGGFAETRVDYGYFYFDRTGTPQRGGGTLFRQREGAGGLDPVLEFGAEIDAFVGTTLTLPVGIPINLSMALAASASYATVTPGDGGFAVADASNTLSFDPGQFFDLDPGISANAGAFIVDNRLPFFDTGTPPTPPAAAVPAPASLALFALGLLGLLGRRQYRSIGSM